MEGLFEGRGTNRSKHPTGNKRSEGNVADGITSLPDADVYKIINSMRSLTNDYKSIYNEYDQMAEDSIIGSALELYADDASQIDGDTGRIINITSSSKTLRDDLLTFLDSLNVESMIWGWAYDVAKYGDKYLKVVRDTNGKFLQLMEVDDPETILDLQNNGVRVNYAEEIPEDERTTKMRRQNQQEYIFYDSDEYVHIMTKNTTKCDRLRVEVQDKDNPGETKMIEYKVLRGRAIIENARGIFRILRVLEDSMLGAKIAKSEYLRVYNVEVGANATPNESRKTINKVKQMFDSKGKLDTQSGVYKSVKSPRPIGDPIFNPVQDGKGSIQIESIGGDLDVKSLVDIDYFTNKLFASLKVPKPYLGFEDSLPGGLGDDTLMLLDIRYGRTVKRITSALVRGLTDICNIWLKSCGRESECDQFVVDLITPSSSEELSRLKELEVRIEFVDRLMSLTNGFSDYLDSPTLIDKMLEVLVDYPELSDAIKKELEEASKRRAKDMWEDNNTEGSSEGGELDGTKTNSAQSDNKSSSKTDEEAQLQDGTTTTSIHGNDEKARQQVTTK